MAYASFVKVLLGSLKDSTWVCDRVGMFNFAIFLYLFHMSQAWKLGYRIDEMVHAWLIQLSELMVEMLMDVQAGWHDCTVHVQGFST